MFAVKKCEDTYVVISPAGNLIDQYKFNTEIAGSQFHSLRLAHSRANTMNLVWKDNTKTRQEWVDAYKARLNDRRSLLLKPIRV